MRRILWLTLSLLALPAVAFAQHPCDTTPVQGTTIVSNVIGFGLCHNQLDELGNSTVLTGFRVTVDGATVFQGALNPIGAASTTGQYYYETPKTIAVAKGSHTAVVYASNSVGESQVSGPYTFTLKGAPPGKGKVQQVVK